MTEVLRDLSFHFRCSKNPVVAIVRDAINGLRSRRLNSVLREIYHNEKLRENLRRKGVEQLVLFGTGDETLSLVPDPKHNEASSWMGIGRMFYGNVETYDHSDHPITEENGTMVFNDSLGDKRDLARYLVNNYPEIRIRQIKGKIRKVA